MFAGHGAKPLLEDVIDCDRPEGSPEELLGRRRVEFVADVGWTVKPPPVSFSSEDERLYVDLPVHEIPLPVDIVKPLVADISGVVVTPGSVVLFQEPDPDPDGSREEAEVCPDSLEDDKMISDELAVSVPVPPDAVPVDVVQLE